MELRVDEVGVRYRGDGRGSLRWRAAVCRRPRYAAYFMPIIVYGEVRIVRSTGPALLLHLLRPRRIWGIASEAGFETVATAVCEKSLHAGGTETGGWWIIEAVPPVFVFGVAVDALALCFSPTYTPGTVLS